MKRVAIVTGASRGIGANIARTLAAEGLHVALLARDEPSLLKVSQSITGESSIYRCDVTKRESVQTTLSTISEQLGPVSVLVNNAGIGGPYHPVNEVTDDEYDLIFATNVRAAFWFCRSLLPAMKQQGFGRVINISSILGLQGASHSSTYIATKHALIGYTRALAAEWGAFGVRCNAICPGYIDTEMLARAKSAESARLPCIPAGRFGKADEVAELCAYLVRDEASYFNGSVLTIDGGISSTLRGV